MSLVRMSPSMRNLISRWPDFWDEDELFNLPTASSSMDVYETEDEVVIRANIAGVTAENVDLTYEKGVLWIKAERTEEESSEPKKKHYSKASWSYSYKVAVPGMLDHTKEPEAKVEHGVLTVTFKKAEASKPKKLTVKSS